MQKIKKLITKNDSQVKVICPVSNTEIAERQKDYLILDNISFAKKYRDSLFNGVTLKIGNNEYNIQANFCTCPFCRWFGLSQYKYEKIKSKPSRYKLAGGIDSKKIVCNDVVTDDYEGIVIDNMNKPLSNWSLAEEIKRLIDINTVKTMKTQYNFHRENCPEIKSNPFDNPTSFYKRGKSSSNSQKYQCKECKKITNVIPYQKENFTYHQQRNDILPQFALQILSRTPVTRTLELLGIGASTYYNKLEWLYRKSLEFLDRHETKALQKKNFDRLWLNTDKFSYYLNNIRKKGHGKNYIEQERPLFPTYIVATVDVYSRYAFRTDIAFDYDITANDIERDIELLKEDHLYNFAQKNARYRYSYYGESDTVDISKEQSNDDLIDKNNLQLRKDYIDGFHVNSTYTAYAQYWLLKRMLNVEKLNFTCDEDNSIISVLMRVYADEIKAGNVNIFTCQIDKTLTKSEAYSHYLIASNRLAKWREYRGLKGSLKEVGIDKLAYDLQSHNFYNYVRYNNKVYPIYNHNPIEHPFPFKDEGIRYVDCITNLSLLSSIELAELLYKVDLRAINTFFNQIRRRVSILERPLVSGRGEGRSYIYANFNPKYAQYLLTILRTYLNFCETFKYKKKEVTPAMLLGIADKPFTLEDIIYFK
jgi:hypothetical protein